jgi:DNA (cytosine-5)-methyltransferase 1
MNFLSTFTGIGGFDLGLERAGWQCVGQCEIEPFCVSILKKHWPKVWRWNDVKTLTGKLIFDNCGQLDAFVGGPPCQPSSNAGKRLGADDDRWLWPDYLRLVSEINRAQERPIRLLLAENPRGVVSLEIEGVQFNEWLAREFRVKGYELLPVKLAAEDIGAPHRRERIFYIGFLADAGCVGLPLTAMHGKVHEPKDRKEVEPCSVVDWPEGPGKVGAIPPEDDGLSSNVAGWLKPRLEAVGNAIVPQCAEIIGRAILYNPFLS